MRIIDLSVPLVCGQNIECEIPEKLPIYEGFPCEEYRFRFQSHVGCYYETAAHLFRGGKMTCDVPVEEFFLPAVVARLDPQTTGVIEPVELAAALKNEIRPGDGLLVDARGQTDRFFSRAAGRWMVEKNVRLLGATLPRYDTGFVNPTGLFVEIFQADIPIIANLKNVEKILHPRVFLVVLPMAVERVCTVPCRAVVFDGEPSQVESLTTLPRASKK